MGGRFIQIVLYTENLEILDKLRETFILRFFYGWSFFIVFILNLKNHFL